MWSKLKHSFRKPIAMGKSGKRYGKVYNFRKGVRNLDIDKKAIFLPTYVFKNEVLTILFWQNALSCGSDKAEFLDAQLDYRNQSKRMRGSV